jgi:glycosyltransferase involved in cell wall biosynthesis
VVKFVGFVEDISSFMYDLDIYICTSKFEGFGFSMAEAMLAQKPVVAFDTSSNPEVVQDQVTGVIVPAYDIELFSDQIIELAHYPELCHEYGTAGRAYVLKHFSKEKQDELLMGVLGY